MRTLLATLTLLLTMHSAMGADTSQTFDIPSRPNATQRVLIITPAQPKAVLILFTGGNGALRVSPTGELGAGKGNFLIRSRQAWVDMGFIVALVDAPSDRQTSPFLSGFRQTDDHLTDVKAVIAALKQNTKLPVWLVGTSRGTQSVAYVTAGLDKASGPDGLVLTSTILTDPKSRSVPDMKLENITIPTLVIHHKQDACFVCKPEALPALMMKLSHASRKELILVDGGITEGDPCEAFAYHGYNGIESEVIQKIATWVLAK